ncbi:MAG: cation transporter dimerization domain-containing protein [Cyanobacteriota bacterium]|nr:cation transporter dimerization domain-containing protein [Cyanobacteriota bacterium]
MTSASFDSRMSWPAAALAQGLLLVGKLALALSLGSLALAADALGSAALLWGALSALLLARWSDPRPDRDHPYGHSKVQAMASLGLTVLLLWLVLDLVQACVMRLWGGGVPLRWWPPALALLLLIAFGQLLLLGPRRLLGWSSLGLALLLPLAASQGWTGLDPLLAVAIAAVVLRDHALALRRQLPWLLDQIALAPEAIHQVAMDVPGVLNCHDIASRGVRGQQIFIDMHMVVDAADLPTAHRITELVEERLEDRFGPVRCTIHLEPREYASAAITFKGAHG